VKVENIGEIKKYKKPGERKKQLLGFIYKHHMRFTTPQIAKIFNLPRRRVATCLKRYLDQGHLQREEDSPSYRWGVTKEGIEWLRTKGVI